MRQFSIPLKCFLIHWVASHFRYGDSHFHWGDFHFFVVLHFPLRCFSLLGWWFSVPVRYFSNSLKCFLINWGACQFRDDDSTFHWGASRFRCGASHFFEVIFDSVVVLLISFDLISVPMKYFSILLECFSTHWAAFQGRCGASKFPWGASPSHWVAVKFYGDDFRFQKGSSNFHWTSSQSIEPLLNSPMVLLISIEVIFHPIVVLSSSIENAFQFFSVDSQFQWSTSQFFWGAFQPNEVLFNSYLMLLTSINVIFNSIVVPLC